MSVDALKKILKKDPIIHTFRPDEFVNDPEFIDEVYSLHAETHMSIGDTQVYFERLVNCLVNNKKTFVGGIVGDYGEGKTSSMVYLWKKCDQEKIFAIPPYVWFNFQDHFRVIYSWTKYRIGKISKSLVHDLDKIYDEFKEPSLENTAKEMTKRTGAKYDEILVMIKEEYDNGSRIIDFTEDNLLQFCKNISELVSKVRYKGLAIFNDELEFTIEHPGNSRDLVLGKIFKLGDTLNNSIGNYGFFFGMPESEYAIISAGRRAILDRLESQKVFIRLSDVYGSDFALKLWKEYTEYFEISDSKNIVCDETLNAIGQICDSSRKDLGNGPRSVISAFNRMIDRHENDGIAYTPIMFIEDCLSDEITLSKGSQLRQKVKSILDNSKVKGNFEESVMLLAAFPNGCPQEIFQKYNLEKEVDELVKATGWGRIVFENSEGYALVGLQQAEIPEFSYLDEILRGFYSHYSAGPEDFENAKKIFCLLIIDSLFEKRQGQQIEGWDVLSQWKHFGSCSYKLFNGTFPTTTKYPYRSVKVIIISEGETKVPKEIMNVPSMFTVIFELYHTEDNRSSLNEIHNLSEISNDLSVLKFKINLLNSSSPVKLGIGVIPENEKTSVPHFPLSLIGYLDEQDIPKNEEREYSVLKQRLIKNIKFSIFNDQMRENNDFDFPIDNKGEFLIQELFIEMCNRRFLGYKTLITQPLWDKKVKAYINLLKQEDISLTIKRGNEPWQPAREHSESRKNIAKAFNVSVSNLNTWLDGIESLVDTVYLQNAKGCIYFKMHPLEELIIEEIEKCPQEKMISISKRKCKWCDANELMKLITPLGYLQEELKLIMGGIGPARKLFDLDNKYIPEEGKKISVLYKAPFTSEEFRSELLEKIKALEIEYSHLDQIDGFSKKKDLEKYIKKIATIENDEQYERIKNELNSFFIINHKWINIKLEDFKSEIDFQLSELSRSMDDIKRNNVYTIITKKVEGQSPWIARFIELIQETLGNQYRDITKELTVYEKEALTSKNAYNLDVKQIASDGPEQLLNFQKNKFDLFQNLDSCKIDIANFMKNFQNYNKWQHLIKKSDEVFNEAVSIKSNPSYKDSSFLEKFEDISKNIENQIVKYNLQILKNYEGFSNTLEDLGDECKKFYYGFKEEFQNIKKIFFDFLERIAAPTKHVRYSFNPLEPRRSYEDYYGLVSSSLNELTNEIQEEIKNMDNEIRYISEVLKLKNKNIDELLETNKITQENLTNLLKEMDIDSLQNNPDKNIILKNWGKSITSIQESVRKLKKIHRKILTPNELEHTEEDLLFSIERGQEFNLKEAILLFRKQEVGKNLDLNQLLEILKSLFKKNAIDIKVKRN